jgi:hypothetical protein
LAPWNGRKSGLPKKLPARLQPALNKERAYE